VALSIQQDVIQFEIPVGGGEGGGEECCGSKYIDDD